jgi:probable rRNA maturation factor
VTRRLYLPPWRVDLTVRPGVRRLVPDVVLGRAVANALVAGSAPWPASIGMILTDDEELAALNLRHMGQSGPTDVLSFPLIPPSSFQGGPRPGFALPPGTRLHLGDVVVSVERAIEQAETGRGGQTGDVRWSPADEIRLLVTHGALHICGLDHAEPDEEAAMRALEGRLLGQ